MLRVFGSNGRASNETFKFVTGEPTFTWHERVRESLKLEGEVQEVRDEVCRVVDTDGQFVLDMQLFCEDPLSICSWENNPFTARFSGSVGLCLVASYQCDWTPGRGYLESGWVHVPYNLVMSFQLAEEYVALSSADPVWAELKERLLSLNNLKNIIKAGALRGSRWGAVEL